MRSFNTAERLQQWLSEHNARQVDILSRAQPFIKQYGIKLSKNDICQYVSGKVEPGQKKLFILAKAMSVSEAWLMGYDDDCVIEQHSKNEPASKSGDELDEEIISLLDSMPREKKKAGVDYLRFLASHEDN